MIAKRDHHDDPAHLDWLIAYYDSQVSRIKSALSVCIETLAVEAFHNLRVGVKRWRACMDLIEWIDPDIYSQPAHREVKSFYKQSGHIRDCHVQMQLILNEDTRYLDGLSEYYNYLKSQEQKYQPKFLNSAGKFDSRTLDIFRTDFIQHLSKLSTAELLAYTEKRLQELLVDLINQKSTDYHELRILAKRTRYILEIFRAGRRSSKNLNRLDKALKVLHQNLGSWHDALITSESLEAFNKIADDSSLRNKNIYKEFAEFLSHRSGKLLDKVPALLENICNLSQF